MANNSSSSSSSLDSSSSSSELFSSSSSSGSSSSSSESSAGFSSSSSSTDSSSSSSLDSSSSSSSSFLDLNDDRLLPFTFSKEKNKSIWSISFDSTYAYAGTSNDGMIIRSNNRYLWENFYKLNDSLVTALLVDSGFLFAGTSPKGKAYRINLSTEEIFLDNTLNGAIVGFVPFKNDMYMATSQPSFVYKFNKVNSNWESFYEPYGETVNQISSFNDKIWLGINGGNILSFNGDSWNIEVSSPDNISTSRRVSKNVYSHSSYDFINTKEISGTDNLSNEEILDIFPYNRLIGVGSFAQDGSTITLGGKNYGRVFNYNNKTLYSLFDTDKTEVQQLLNLDVGANLAAIGDSLYLIHCGDISTVEESIVEETEDLNEGKTVVIKSPNGGEQIEIGSEIDILWTSTKGVNDGVKIALYKSGVEVLVISTKTSNDGLFTWEVPLSIAEGTDYQMYIEWISATETVADLDKDLSDANFSLLITVPSSVSSESIADSTGVPDINQCRGVPIINFRNEEKITFMTKDKHKGGVLFATSLGRVLYADEATLNAYRSGERLIYAEVTNGYGATSDTVANSFMYALYKRLFEINESKEIKKWKYLADATLSPIDQITAEFLSPVLKAQEDIGFWKELMWSEDKPADTNITVCIRSGESADSLQSSDWSICYRSNNESNPITRNLNNVSLAGAFAQIKVIMLTKVKNITPTVTNVNLVYSTKRAQYFYSTKFSLESGSNINKAFLTGTISEPTNTEIIFGYNDEDSSNWDDYTIIDTDKFFEVPDINSVKVGIKMISYDESLPVVDEFGIILSGDKKNLINK
jgi:hypothetical protein